MAYQDHLTKFVVLLPLHKKSTDEVVKHQSSLCLDPCTFCSVTTVDISQILTLLALLEIISQRIGKNAGLFDVGYIIITPIPVLDRKTSFDPPNLAVAITGTSENGHYELGKAAGALYRRYISTEIDLVQNFSLLP